MVKNKNNQAIWNTRIKKQISTTFQKFGSSINVDKRLFKEDIQGSIVHVEMLFKQKIISFRVKNKIIYGLKKIQNEIIKKKFDFNINYEDIHMNIEKRLFQIIGDDAGYKLCRQEVFQKVYESHRHTFERLLREATACGAMGKEILSVLK